MHKRERWRGYSALKLETCVLFGSFWGFMGVKELSSDNGYQMRIAILECYISM